MPCSLLSKLQLCKLVPSISFPQFSENSLHLEVKSSRDIVRPFKSFTLTLQTSTESTNLVCVSLTWPGYFCLRMQSCPALSFPKDVQAEKNRVAVLLVGQKTHVLCKQPRQIKLSKKSQTL